MEKPPIKPESRALEFHLQVKDRLFESVEAGKSIEYFRARCGRELSINVLMRADEYTEASQNYRRICREMRAKLLAIHKRTWRKE